MGVHTEECTRGASFVPPLPRPLLLALRAHTTFKMPALGGSYLSAALAGPAVVVHLWIQRLGWVYRIPYQSYPAVIEDDRVMTTQTTQMGECNMWW